MSLCKQWNSVLAVDVTRERGSDSACLLYVKYPADILLIEGRMPAKKVGQDDSGDRLQALLIFIYCQRRCPGCLC